MNHEYAMSDANRSDVIVPTIKELRAARAAGVTLTGEAIRAARRSAIDLRSKADDSTSAYLKKNADLLKRNASLLVENGKLAETLRLAKTAEITLRRLMLKHIS
jgi:hypothetical protein